MRKFEFRLDCILSTRRNKKVIVAPLNWGWGHATRCIPILRELIAMQLTPVIACDGDALKFLQQEFPTLETITLASYNIQYKRFIKLGMLLNAPCIVKAIYKEHISIKNYVKAHKDEVCAIISDNRFGVYVKGVKSVYITHQLNMRLGMLSFVANKIHQYCIAKHAECWVPDEYGSLFSGNLSKSKNIKAHYVGVLSRFKPKTTPIKYDILVLLSGIEGQRVALENRIVAQLQAYKGRILLVRGTFAKTKTVFPKHVKVVDYLLSDALEEALQQSKLVVSRSGYSTVMDLAKLNKQMFLIPTPGQTEQEYLATYLQQKNIAMGCSEKEFTLKKLLITPTTVRLSNQKTNEQLLQQNLRRFLL